MPQVLHKIIIIIINTSTCYDVIQGEHEDDSLYRVEQVQRIINSYIRRKTFNRVHDFIRQVDRNKRGGGGRKMF